MGDAENFMMVEQHWISFEEDYRQNQIDSWAWSPLEYEGGQTCPDMARTREIYGELYNFTIGKTPGKKKL